MYILQVFAEKVGKKAMNEQLKSKVLNLIENDARLTVKTIAVMLDKTQEEIRAIVDELEKSGVVLGYKALVDWDKTEREYVTALIELKVTPQRERGFERVAEKIRNFPEVQNMYLMSGAYDFCVIVEGKTMKQVALFVAEKLAPIEGVISTSTHFVLRKYKDMGVPFGYGAQNFIDERGNLN